MANKKGNFDEVFKDYENSQAIDLLKKMLVFDPDNRITVEQALEHPYMNGLHFPEDEPIGTPVSDFDFDFELFSLKIPELKELIYEEIKLYHDSESYANYLQEK